MRHSSHPAPFVLSVLAGGLLLFIGGCSSNPFDSLSRADKETMLQTHQDFAFTWFSMGRYDQALDQINKALELDKDHVEMRVLMGQILLIKGGNEDVHRAELVYRSLLRDKDVRAALGLAKALERKGLFYDEAARLIESGKRSTNADDPKERAEELAKQAQKFWKESEKRYLETLEIKGDDREALNGMQRLMALVGRDAESLDYAQQVLEVTSGEREFWLTQLERPDLTALDEDSCRRSLREIEELEVKTNLHVAAVHVANRRYEEALPHLRRVSEIDPLLPAAYSQRAQLFKKVGNYESAIVEIDEFLRLSELPFDHPDINAAYALKVECEAELSASRSARR